MIRFHDPVWLIGLGVAVPFAIVALRWFATMTSARRWSAIIARTVLIAVIVGSLAGAASVRTTDEVAVIALVDVSDSVRRFSEAGDLGNGTPANADPIEAARRLLGLAGAERGEEDLLGIVAFGERAITVATPTAAEVSQRTLDVDKGSGTAIARAMRTGASLIPPTASGRFLLISDGNQTSGDALAEAQRLAALGIPVDVLPVRTKVEREVVVERLDAPPRAPVDSVVTLRVALRATERASGTLRILRENEPVDLNGSAPGTGIRVNLDPGVNIERVEVPLRGGRIHRFEAIFEPDQGDTDRSNNRATASTVSPGRGSVLLLTTEFESPLGPVLRDAGFDVSKVGPESSPVSLLELEPHDLIVLESVPADELPEDTQELIVTSVRELGLGLVMVGGRGSFAAGGWRGSVIEPLLPVHLDLPERLTIPQAAVVFVIDSSGSMSRPVGGSMRTQQVVANEATALAIQSLDAGDLTGIVAFNLQARTILPIAANTPERATEAALSIASGGGTDIGPALERAGSMLRSVEAQQKEIIVLTDGYSEDPERLPEIAGSLRDANIRITTIGVGDEADGETLQEVAAAGGGLYYSVLNPLALPRIFIKAVRLVREPMIKNERFTPVFLGGGSPITLGIEPLLGSSPDLYGLALARTKEEPGVTTSIVTPAGEPVLADWNAGLGRVVAFTSDARAVWARDWLTWPGYREMWTSIARAASRPSPDPGLALTTTVQEGRLKLRMEAQSEDGSPIDYLRIPATVFGPNGSREVMLEQTGPGVYEAIAPAPETGSYYIIASPSDGAAGLPPVFSAVGVAAGAELRALEADLDLLRDIAQQSGGRVLAPSDVRAESLFDRSLTEPREAEVPLYSTLLLWAVAVLMLDIGTRRIAWDRLRFHAPEDAGTQRKRGLAAAMVTDRLGRSRSKRDGGEAALGAADADRLATREAAERRRRLREQALASKDTASSGPRAAPIERATKKQEPDAPADGGASGLLAAKKRARERMDDE
ncbi:MAG: VWA domain-containing protein [Planctomycetota bacterium]